MDYNTQRNKLIIPEYGRNIQKMIEQCVAIEDRDKRSKTAEVIVNVMGQMTAKGGKEPSDFKQKLWDHLHIISNFELDIDSPYPPPDKGILASKPNKVEYSDGRIRYRHYGKNIEAIIEKAVAYPDGEEKNALILTIANHLKKSYLNWNRNSVDDELILKHLEDLSHSDLKLEDVSKLSKTNDILAMNKKKRTPEKRGSSNGYKGGSNGYKGRKRQ